MSVILTALILLFSGCAGNDPVEELKKMTLPENTTESIGTLLDTGFDNITWRSSEIDNGMAKVIFNGTTKFIKQQEYIIIWDVNVSQKTAEIVSLTVDGMDIPGWMGIFTKFLCYGNYKEESYALVKDFIRVAMESIQKLQGAYFLENGFTGNLNSIEFVHPETELYHISDSFEYGKYGVNVNIRTLIPGCAGAMRFEWDSEEAMYVYSGNSIYSEKDDYCKVLAKEIGFL